MKIALVVNHAASNFKRKYLYVSLLSCVLTICFFQIPTGSAQLTAPPVSRPEIVLQTGHTMRVDAVAFGGNGRWLASGSADNTVRIWDTLTNRELRTMSGNPGWVKAVAVSPDGRLLAAGNLKGTCKIWEANTGRELHTLAGHTAAVTAIAFSSDGRTLATGSADNTARLWDVASGGETRVLNGHTGWVTALAFAPDGRTLATGSADKTIKLWQTATGEAATAHTLTKNTGKINALAFNPDASRLASGASDGEVKLWQTQNGRELSALQGHQSSPILLVTFDSDGRTLVSGSANKIVIFRDAVSGRIVRTVDESASLEAVQSIAYNPAQRLLALGSGNKVIALWDVSAAEGKTERQLKSTSAGVYSVAFSQDKRWFATAGKDQTVKLWEASSGRNVRTLKGHTGWVTTIAFDPKSELLAAGSLSGEIRIWEVVGGREVRKLAGHTASVNTIAFSPDGRTLASASGDGTARLWDAASGNLRLTLSNHKGEVHALAFAPDGKTLATGGEDKTVRLWDAETGAETRTLNGHAGVVYSAAFTEDNRTLATGDGAGAIKLWDTRAPDEARTITHHKGWVTALSFSRDKTVLASGGQDGAVVLTDIAPQGKQLRLAGHTSAVNGVAFNPDANLIASSGEDGSTRFWDAKTGAPAATLVALGESEEWIVVAPNGLFDGTPAAWNEILWRFGGDTFAVAPVEIFFNEFYYPGLLGELLAGRPQRAATDIARKDRRQPRVNLELANAAQSASGTRQVAVKLEIAEAAPDATYAATSGVRDVRLFRNGLLVKVWRGDLKTDAKGRATLETSVPIVAGDNRLTAYAFSRENIKSLDATLDLAGDNSLRREATAYVVAIGVNTYSNAGYNLKFAVPDANDFSEQVRSSHENLLGRFARVETVTLLNEEATKANVLLALERLAGVEKLPPDAPASLSKLKAAQPEDAVVLFFAGHGVAHKNSFYLMPHDIGYKGSRRRLTEAGFQTILDHSISDRELETSFESVGAGQILFVLDACNSGQALEADERRRGPMNSRGLAQLAYEKGMYILTAAQSYQAALEVTELGHGLLTYALVEEGLKNAQADTAPRDGRLMLVEWLNYATARVPQIQIEKMQKTRGLTQGVAFVEGEEQIDSSQRNVQRPRVFYRRDTPVPLVAIK